MVRSDGAVRAALFFLWLKRVVMVRGDLGRSIGIVMIVTLLTACSKVDDTHDHPSLMTGEALFNYHCAGCHGEDGTGKLVDRTPSNILTKKGRLAIADYITSNTGGSRTMPVFSAMPRAEALEIASHLLLLTQQYNALDENKKKSEALMLKP
jgi:mono/diheme cytochrome c family protein